MAADDEEVDPLMTQPSRRTHFRVWIALAVLLPLLFAAGLAVRRTATPDNPNLRWENYK